MVLIHGFNAHSGYMAWPGEQFVARGFAAYALDLRGRGESEGERFYVEDFSDYLSDVHSLVSLARSEHPGLPLYVLGHSAGGVIASSYVFEHQDEIAGLVCESFAFDVGLPHLVQLPLQGVSHLAPHLHVFSLNNHDFSRDPAAVERMNNDPLIAKESQPAETASEMLKAAAASEGEHAGFTVPVLIIHGTADKATRPAGSQYFYDHAGARTRRCGPTKATSTISSTTWTGEGDGRHSNVARRPHSGGGAGRPRGLGTDGGVGANLPAPRVSDLPFDSRDWKARSGQHSTEES